MTQRPLVNIIVAGGRDFDDYDLLKSVIDHMTSKLYQTHDIVIVSGDARGADTLGKRYAHEHYNIGIGLKVMKADWDKYGKSAGYLRNQEMADYSTHLIAFWDGKSRGTKHMIDIATRQNLKCHVVNY